MLELLTQIDRRTGYLAKYLPQREIPSTQIKGGVKATLPFDRWLSVVTPAFSWDWRHLAFIRSQLHRLTRGEIKRLMLSVPPRHGKSEQVTVRYAAWRLESDPALRVIIGAYNQTLANKFSRKIRRIAESRVALRRDRTAVEDWETTAGGGIRAVGVGGGITGQGGNLVIIDDPIKNREEANSETYREKVWDWYRDDLYTRLEPNASLVLIMTRWHEDDLAGRILKSEDAGSWTVLNLPALAESGDPLNRPPGTALCPERYDEKALEGIRGVLGSYSFSALFQGRPLPAEGGLFKRYWFEIVSAAPVDAKRVRYWDKAGTADGGAYSCGVKMSRDSKGIVYVEDVTRGQWSAGQREAVIRQTAEMDSKAVSVWYEQEPGSGGKESAEATTRNLAGFTARADRVTGDKVTRAEPFAAQCEASNVRLVSGKWNAAYLDELTSFPYGKYKDQVDASSGAFAKLVVPGVSSGRTAGIL